MRAPAPDRVLVERACAGHRVALTLPERREAVLALSRHRSLSVAAIAERVGLTPRSVQRMRARLRLLGRL